MGTYWTNPVRHPEDTGIGYLRRTITLADFSANGNLVPIGALEAGAITRTVDVYVATVFNAGTTNPVSVGTVADDDGYATAATVISTATGWKGALSGALTGIPEAANVIVYAKFAPTGIAATTGKITITLPFVIKREVEGTTFPAN